MNMHVETPISGGENLCLIGKVVSINGGRSFGRVTAPSEHWNDQFQVNVFSEEPNLLTVPVACLEILEPIAPLDIGEVHDQTFKILQALELIRTLVQTEIEKANLSPIANHDREAFLNNVQFLASTFADMASHVLDSLPATA